MLLHTCFAYLVNSFSSRWYAWGEKDFFTCLFHILEGTNYKTSVISYGCMALFFGLKPTVKTHVHFIANPYIRYHLAYLITFEHLIFGSRFGRSVQMLRCTLLVPALRSPGCFSCFFLFSASAVFGIPTPGAQNSRCYA